jgi:hypothetical protein
VPGWDVDRRFRPVAAAGAAGGVPVLVTRAGRESPEVAATVGAFIAGVTPQNRHLEVIDVPEGQHSFDMLDHTGDSRTAVSQAMTWVTETLRR